MWITPDYSGLLALSGLLWFTWITSDCTDLFRVTSNYFGLLRITLDYQLDHQVFQRITTDYCGLRRITPGHLHSSDCSDLLGLLRFTSNYCRLLQITSDYQFGSPSVPVDYRSTLWITPDYSGLLALSGLLWFTWITSDCTDLFRVTSNYFKLPRIAPNYFGLPVGSPSVPADYHRLL